MKRRKLKVRVDPTNIAFSRVTDQESDDLIDGVINISWEYDRETGAGLVALIFDATMIDFEIVQPPGKDPPK